MRAQPRMTVAETLRMTREQAGYSLEDVGALLRIRMVYLRAIEDGRFGDLPGSVYAVGFVRTYADLLGLSSEDIVRSFKEEIEGARNATELVFPEPVTEGRVPGGAILLIALVLAGLAYGGWYYFSTGERSFGDMIDELPDRFALLLGSGEDATTPDGTIGIGSVDGEPTAGETEGSPDDPAAGDGAPQSAELGSIGEVAPDDEALPQPGVADDAPAVSGQESPVTEATPRELPLTAEPESAVPEVVPEAAAPEEMADLPEAPAALDETAPPPPPAADAGTDAAAAPAPAGRVVLRATGQSWIQIRSAAGDLVQTRVMQAGESYEVPVTTGLRLVTGNAGALSIEVDGRTMAPLGSYGQVVRDVLLDPEALLARGE